MKSLCYILLVLLFLPNLFWCAEENAKTHDKSSSTTALTKRLGDENIFMSLFKGVVEFASNGFKTGLEASMRSLFNKPVTTAVYALSMLVGVVAMLAFYESPVSPLPVPPLPDPPVGRFPPEHPIWPPQQQAQGQNMGFNHKRAGFVPHSMNPHTSYHPSAMASQHIYQYVDGPHSDSRYHDKNMPNIHNRNLNETSYNNYISKLTAPPNLSINNNKADSLKQVYNINHESSNKVIDYTNKRIAVESLKYNNNNNQTVS